MLNFSVVDKQIHSFINSFIHSFIQKQTDAYTFGRRASCSSLTTTWLICSSDYPQKLQG